MNLKLLTQGFPVCIFKEVNNEPDSIEVRVVNEEFGEVEVVDTRTPLLGKILYKHDENYLLITG
jgi:hypothetical protein